MIMSEDRKTNEEAIDKIHLDENYEVEAWCQMFEITTADLKHAVEVVGPSAVKVKEYIHQQHLNSRNSLR
jgi:hypothetical protein